MYHLYNRHSGNDFVFREDSANLNREGRKDSLPDLPCHISNPSDGEESGLHAKESAIVGSRQYVTYDAGDLAYDVAACVEDHEGVIGNHPLDHAGVQAYNVAARVVVQDERSRSEAERRRENRLRTKTQYIMQLALLEDDDDDDNNNNDTEQLHETDQVSSSHSKNCREAAECAQFSDASEPIGSPDHRKINPQDARVATPVPSETDTQQTEIPSEIQIRNKARNPGQSQTTAIPFKISPESSEVCLEEKRPQRNLQAATAVYKSRNEINEIHEMGPNDSEVATTIPINAVIIDDQSYDYYHGKQKLVLWLPSSSA